MMIEGGIYGYAIPLGRMIAGLFIGTMLAIVGGWLGLTFNAMSGVPWSLEVHRFIYIACIGLGAGVALKPVSYTHLTLPTILRV